MSGLIDPADGGFDITPNDTVNLTVPARGLYLAESGDVKVDMINGNTITFSNMAAGIVHPLQVRRVYSTGTTASGIIGVL